MTRNPVVNALLAVLYITLVSSIMFFGSKMITPEETIIIPISMLSLFSLSVAMMSFIFFYQPIIMYLEGEKKMAVKLVLKTIATFAVITTILFMLMVLQDSVENSLML
jgi:hypothetical protein